MSKELSTLLGNEFVGKDGKAKSLEDCVGDAKLVCLYFSAHWCGPCRRFTPELCKVVKELKAAKKKVCVIFGSSDKDQSSFQSYFGEMEWDNAFALGNAKIDELKKEYGVSGIPWLVVLDENGKLIQNEADTQVGQKGAKAFDAWLS